MPRSAPILAATLLLAALLAPACGGSAGTRGAAEDAPRLAPGLAERVASFRPTVLEADLSGLDETERRVLDLLIEASRPLDQIFLRQASGENERWARRLRSIPGEEGALARLWFDVHKGIYERHAEWRPFVEDASPRPPGGGFYPADLTKEEFRAFLDEHPDREAELVALTTVVVRGPDGLEGVPYSEAFAKWLEPAKESLREAASLTRDAALREYLEELVVALDADRYTDADMAWMDQGGTIELTFGPYETYEDELFGYKAAYESFVTIVDAEASEKLARLEAKLPALERALPIPDEHKNLARGASSPIRVADLVFSSGDARAGVQTIAFNLPNDEEVRERKGSKKVLLRNVMAAKFDAILTPIAGRVLAPRHAERLSREAFVDEVLHHELSHGLGPGRIDVEGTRGEVREFLQEHYTAIEEAKADAVGMHNLIGMIEGGEIDAYDVETIAATYVAGLFRAARWGTASAHGKGAAVQYHLLREAGALTQDPAGRLLIDLEAFPGALRDVASRLLMIQALGDRDAAAALIARHGSASPEMQALIDGLSDIAVDIRPIYPVAGESG